MPTHPNIPENDSDIGLIGYLILPFFRMFPKKQPSLKMLFRLADALEVQASAIIAEMEKERRRA